MNNCVGLNLIVGLVTKFYITSLCVNLKFCVNEIKIRILFHIQKYYYEQYTHVV